MTAIVHTADVHLREDAPERLAALAAVLDVATDRGAELVTIGGDLFDRPRDVEALRSRLRNELFTDLDCEVVVIPGNHDVAAFRGDTFFGDMCTVAVDRPYSHVHLAEHDVRLTAAPYAEGSTEELLLDLEARDPYDGLEVLLIHCTLDVGLPTSAAGTDEEARYLPMTPDQLEALGFDAVLAGHHHAPREEHLGATRFVYPGTPASTRASETGPRQAVCLDPEGGLEFVPLDSYHRMHRTARVLPGREDAVVEALETWMADAVDEHAEAEVTVVGFHARDEATFHHQLEQAVGSTALTDETRSVAHLQNDALYRSIEAKLEETDWDESTRTTVRHRLLAAFTNLQGELP